MKFECVINDTVETDLTEEDLNILNGLAGFTLMQSLSDIRLTKVARELTSLAKSENFIANQKKAAWKILGIPDDVCGICGEGYPCLHGGL